MSASARKTLQFDRHPRRTDRVHLMIIFRQRNHNIENAATLVNANTDARREHNVYFRLIHVTRRIAQRDA